MLLFSVLFGFALSALGRACSPVVNLLEQNLHGLFGMVIGFIMKLAPDWRFWRDGLHHWQIMAYKACPRWRPLMGTFYFTCGVCVWRAGQHCPGQRIFDLELIKYIREELLIVLGTSSSESAATDGKTATTGL